MSPLGRALVALGVAFLYLAGLGIMRFRDPYSRLQAAGVGDVGAALFLVLGMVLGGARGWERAILGLLGVLLLFTGPAATHVIARGAFLRRHPPKGEP